MARRKKEPAEVHRSNIAIAAEKLFMGKGIQATTMDDVAKEAGYSKATLYVYYENKEEIVGTLVLKSMNILFEHIHTAIASCSDTRSQYLALCNSLVHYQEQYPLYFELALGEIKIDLEDSEALPVEKETFAVGERINAEVVKLIEHGVCNGSFRRNIRTLPTVFLLWASIAGIIQMAEHKAPYIEKSMGMTKQEFLAYGFDTLYASISKQEVVPK